MTYDEIEAKLKTAVEHATPDKLDEILKRCTPPDKQTAEEKVVELPPRPRRKWVKTLAAVAAAFVLVAAGAAGLMNFNDAGAVKAVIGIDVNPSLQIKIDAQDKVLEVTAKNEDGEKILDGLELKGVGLDSAVNSVVEKLVREGFITNKDNSMLVFVHGKNPEEAENLRQSVAGCVENSLGRLGISSALLSGSSYEKDAAAVKTAKDFGISEPKASLVLDISGMLPGVSEQDLANLTISELNVLMNVNGISAEGFISCGVPNLDAYISPDLAVFNTLKYVSIPKLGESKIAMSCKNGKLTYEVKFGVGDLECSCEMNAGTGEVMGYLAELQKIGQDIGDESKRVTTLSEESLIERVLKSVSIPGKDAKEFSIESSDDGYDVKFEARGLKFDCELDSIGKVVKIAADRVDEILTQPAKAAESNGIIKGINQIGQQLITNIFKFIGLGKNN